MMERLLVRTRWTLGVLTLLATAGAGLVGSDGSPALAGGGGCRERPANPDAVGDAVSMTGYCFAPLVLRVQPGTKVTFRNNDEAVHQVNGLAWGSSGIISKDALSEQKFDQPGLYPYACILHPGMVGVIVVGDGKFVGAGTGRSAVQDVNASVAQPVATAEAVAAKATAPVDSEGRSAWLYVGLGALAGVALAAAAGGVVVARR